SGYEVYMKTGSGKYKLVKTINKGKTVSYTQSKLKKGTKYTFKVRAYKSAGGQKVYGAYSKTKSIRLK
ncbi:MAG: fibronectin type III domain-containing protein, partial [Clostridium sp.]|nr:fibronectin type III domain-containing protein [Clostridium sp.]